VKSYDFAGVLVAHNIVWVDSNSVSAILYSLFIVYNLIEISYICNMCIVFRITRGESSPNKVFPIRKKFLHVVPYKIYL